MDKKDLENYFERVSLEKTISNGTYFEQKITPDVLSFTARCILELTNEDLTQEFSDNQLRDLDFFEQITTTYFSKPGQSSETENEYNKFTSYHLGLLEFSGILEEVSQRPKKYKIIKLEILKFISENDRNALIFLEAYLKKLLIDNNFSEKFKEYKDQPTQQKYVWLKDQFWRWAREHTGVRGNLPTHTNRVFNKIFNLFAYTNSLPGESRARIREGLCPYRYLIYNRLNFRDVNRPMGMSRLEYNKIIERDVADVGWIALLTQTAKSKIRARHLTSEVDNDNYSPEINGRIQVHHIFSRAEYLEFSSYLENLISLTAGQHNSHAHDRGPQSLNKKFQIICLLAKLESINASINQNDSFYDLKKFVEILNKGLGLSLPEDIPIETIKTKLKELKREN